MDKEKLRAKLDERKRALDDMNAHKQRLAARIRELEAEDRYLERAEITLSVEHDLLHDAYLVFKGVPEKVKKLRSKAVALRRKVKSDDITKREEAALDAQLKKTLELLETACAHPFVIQVADNFEGDRGWDYDNRRHALRKCAVCGLFDRATNIVSHAANFLGAEQKENYMVLPNSPDRVVIRHHAKDDIWQPLNQIRKWFVDERVSKLLRSKR